MDISIIILVDSRIIYTIINSLYKEKPILPSYYVLPYLLNGPINSTFVWEIKTERFFNPSDWSAISKQRRNIGKDWVRQLAKIVYDGVVFREIEKYNLIDKRNAKRDIYNIDGFLEQHVGKVKLLRQHRTSHYFSIYLPDTIEEDIKAIKLKSKIKYIP